MKNIGKILKNSGITIGIVGVIAVAATLLSDTNSAWYLALKKPDFQPPAWAFGVAWPVIYVLSAAALFVMLQRGCANRKLYGWFAVQGVLHLLWVISFFQLHLVGLSMAVLVLYFAAVLGTAWKSRPCIGAFSWLFVPHLLWLVLAGALNYVILLIN